VIKGISECQSAFCPQIGSFPAASELLSLMPWDGGNGKRQEEG
jgi:hypothetical protein